MQNASLVIHYRWSMGMYSSIMILNHITVLEGFRVRLSIKNLRNLIFVIFSEIN